MILENLKDKKIILGSGSPRRQMLLAGLELKFEIRKPDVEEKYPDHLKREAVARYLSELKASVLSSELQDNELLITSDTIVCLDDKILEKPTNHEEARNMLRALSGREHEVISAVTLSSLTRQVSFHDQTLVKFVSLSDDEIDYYISAYHPFDKAGSYGAQELIGYIAIDRLEGSYFNVMGLPVHKLYAHLKSF